VLESYAYFSQSLSMTLYLTDEHGFSDENAGWLYGTFGMLISVYGLLFGWVVDCLGIRMSLVVGGTISAVGRLLFALAGVGDRTMLYLSIFVFLPIGSALGIPVLTIAVKRYSDKASRTFAFGLFYAVMNIAALISGPATDFCNSAFKDGTVLFGHRFSGLRIVFLSGVLTTILEVLVACCCLKDIRLEVDSTGTGVTEIAYKPPKVTTASAFRALKERKFWRLFALSFMVVAVKLIFRHLDATMPKWMRRTMGEDASYGSMYAINPAIIILLVPTIAALTKHVAPYPMILYGSMVSASSVFFLCLGSHYWSIALFVVFLSLGEAAYSPKFYEYSMELSEEGNEGKQAINRLQSAINRWSSPKRGRKVKKAI
jgi:dipeptide/tripeptide permease